MKISMHAMSYDVFKRALAQLQFVMEKAVANAKARNFETGVLVDARLAPDMLPFVKQIQIASDNAKFGVARLAGIEAPKFEDNEKTLDELKARILKTIDFLKSTAASAFEGAEDRDIKITVPNRTIEMKGLAYLNGWVLPNVFFHVTTAYLILRHNGVDVGKRDFLGG